MAALSSSTILLTHPLYSLSLTLLTIPHSLTITHPSYSIVSEKWAPLSLSPPPRVSLQSPCGLPPEPSAQPSRPIGPRPSAVRACGSTIPHSPTAHLPGLSAPQAYGPQSLTAQPPLTHPPHIFPASGRQSLRLNHHHPPHNLPLTVPRPAAVRA